MSDTLIKSRVANTLMEIAKLGPFYRVLYDATNAGRVICPTTETNRVSPLSVLTNEISALFGDPAVNRREARRERQSVTWQLIIVFPCEVATERFEDALLREKLVIPEGDGVDQIALELASVDYSHPPRQQAESGTRVIYTVIATPHSV